MTSRTTDEENPGQFRPRSMSESTPLLVPRGGEPAFLAATVPSRGQTTAEVLSTRLPEAPLEWSEHVKKQAVVAQDSKKGNIVIYLVYAVVNVIIAIPALYGYAAVIFSHPVFRPHMNALSKLVVFSSLMHQLGFLIFSTLDFAIGTVQDAGLIFLSTMSSAIANRMIADGESEEAILSTTMVILSAGTALLGLILVALGKFKLANAVSYLPMPVVGGYLAFIGYFCIQAGVALCISRPMETFVDWKYLANTENFILALPGLVAGVALVLVSRSKYSNTLLPLTMVALPVLFYIIIFAFGYTVEEARDGGWVGAVAPPTPVSDLFGLVDFSLVRWDLAGEVLWTWMGMVFVVSFASCLDVAAISMDMGEALDTNQELATVGICNFMSGMTFGFTGSYIFSQTIFTYRTGAHSRWVGFFIMMAFLYFVVSPMNLLEVSPLFFLGSTLIFIGYDLLFEWLYEIRERVIWSEYVTVWGTFIAIQFAGIDGGIAIGVLFAVFEHVVANAQATNVDRVNKRSRAVWTRDESKFLNKNAYHQQAPKIVSIEVSGPVFFGSSLTLLEKLAEEVGVTSATSSSGGDLSEVLQSPRTSSHLLAKGRTPSFFRNPKVTTILRPPEFCVLDLTQVSNLDASAARGCFLQFTRMCQKVGMTVCASGATPHIVWTLQSHESAYTAEECEIVKGSFQAVDASTTTRPTTDRILLFLTAHEALEFCEASLIHKYCGRPRVLLSSSSSSLAERAETTLLSEVFGRILGASPEEMDSLRQFDNKRYYEDVQRTAGERIVTKGSRAEALYVVLHGAVASGPGRSGTVYRHRQKVVSGAGPVHEPVSSKSDMLDPLLHGNTEQVPIVATIWPVGGVFGYTDLLLDRPYTFNAFATQNDTHCAQISRSHLNMIHQEDPVLSALLHRVILMASLSDLSNCTCDDV